MNSLTRKIDKRLKRKITNEIRKKHLAGQGPIAVADLKRQTRGLGAGGGIRAKE